MRSSAIRSEGIQPDDGDFCTNLMVRVPIPVGERTNSDKEGKDLHLSNWSRRLLDERRFVPVASVIKGCEGEEGDSLQRT